MHIAIQVTLYRLCQLDPCNYESVCVCVFVTAEKKGINLKDNKRGYLGGFGGQKGMGEWCNYVIISKTTLNSLKVIL